MMRGLPWLLLASLLQACAALPPRGPAPASNAFTDTAHTTLARIAEQSLAGGPDAGSGFRLLPTGEFAFGARTALAVRAERSIDAQYYHLHSDAAGAIFLRELRDAASRGVRVRLLVDDFHAAPVFPLLAGLDAHANVQVRLFNPLPARQGLPLARMLLSFPVFERINHRMHNKLVVADNAVAIFGGRNVADEYFMRHDRANFVDLDVIAAGAVVRDLSASFDQYWNSEYAYPLRALLPQPADGAAAQASFQSSVSALKLERATQASADPLGQPSVDSQLAAGRLQLHAGQARVIADPPSKVGGPVRFEQASSAMQSALDAIASAQSEVVIVSPYFVPGRVGMRLMAQASRTGLRVRIYTNSLGSTDEPLAHYAYSRYRRDMLRLGVELYEFSPTLARRSGRFGNFGQSISRLHAKAAVVDRRWMLVGSVNLDGRSALFNTELSVIIDSPPLATAAASLLGSDGNLSMHRVQLAADGQTIEWHARDGDGKGTVTHEEPYGSWLTLWLLWLQSHFVGEEQL